MTSTNNNRQLIKMLFVASFYCTYCN